MANELSITYPGDDTLYALIRRHDDAWPWNTTAGAFTAWDDDDLGDYGIALANRSGDFHQGDWPALMPVGTYHALYYRQTGAEPDTDDLLIGADEVTWDGTSITEPPPPEPDERDLVDLAAVKRHMRIGDAAHDEVLTALITQVSQQIERLCRRTFRRQTYRLNTRCLGEFHILLPHYPVASVDRLATGIAPALTIQTDVDQLRGSVSIEGNNLNLTRTVNTGVVVRDVIDLTTATTSTQLAEAVNDLEGWTAAVVIDLPSDELRPTPQVSSGNGEITLTYAPSLVNNFTLEPESGLITLPTSWKHASFHVIYQAGYETIPPDLQLLACDLVAEAFHRGRHDPNVSRETLGSYNRTMHRITDMCAARAQQLRPYINLSSAIG